MVGSQYFLLMVLIVSSSVYCKKDFKEFKAKLCQSNLSADVVTALGKCFDQRPAPMVTATQTCMTQIGKSTVTEPAVRQVMCDATDGPKLWKCMRENMKPMTQTGTGSTPAASSGAPTGGSGAPHFKHDGCIKNALALQKTA